MRIEISFDPEIYRKQKELLFQKEWATSLKANKKKIYTGIFLLILSGFIILNEYDSGFIFLAISIHYFINCYTFYDIYKDSKLENFKEIESEITKSKKSNLNTVWVFQNNFFEHSHDGFTGKYEWNKFGNYENIENTLTVFFKNTNQIGFCVSKEEINENDFNKIIAFIEPRLNKI